MEKIRKGRRGRPSKFDDAFRRKVVLEFHHGRETLDAIARRYEVGRTTIAFWISQYEQEQQRLLTLGSMGADNTGSTSVNADKEKNKAPAASELKALQEELHLAKVKLACLETLIDLTERDLGIDIRKKAGTRSSEE